MTDARAIALLVGAAIAYLVAIGALLMILI